MEETTQLDGVLKLIDLIVKVLVIPAAIFAFRAIRKRWNIPIQEEQAKDLERALERSILYTEEQGIKAWKQSRVLPGPEKLELAKTKAREFSATGLASVQEHELVALIEAKVNEMRPRMSSAPPPPASMPPSLGPVLPRPPATPRGY